MYNSPIRNNKLIQEAYLKGYRQALNEQMSPVASPPHSHYGNRYLCRHYGCCEGCSCPAGWSCPSDLDDFHRWFNGLTSKEREYWANCKGCPFHPDDPHQNQNATDMPGYTRSVRRPQVQKGIYRQQPNMRNSSVHEAYQRGYRQALNEQPSLGPAPNLTTSGSSVPTGLGSGPSGDAPKDQFGDWGPGGNYPSPYALFLNQIWGDNWWEQWVNIWNDINWPWYGWTEQSNGDYWLQMPGQGMTVTVSWNPDEGWIFGMIPEGDPYP